MQKPFFGESVTGAPGPAVGSDGVEAERREREVEVAVRGVEDERVGDRRVWLTCDQRCSRCACRQLLLAEVVARRLLYCGWISSGPGPAL